MGNPTATELARPLDTKKQQLVSISLNVKQIEVVNSLYKTGFWGSSPTQVVHRLLDEALKIHSVNDESST